MNPITIIGLLAGTLTTIAFLPQLIKTLKLKETKDLSLWMYIILCTGVFLWLVYGLLIKDLPIIAANGISLVLASIILFYKIRYN
jgi:MtN3 and saliva related transmembrane protein